MTDINIDAGIARLRQCLAKIKSLLAWQQLKSQEARPDRLFSFTIDDHVDEDLRNECSLFIATLQRLREMAGSSYAGHDKGRQSVICILCRLEREFIFLPIAADISSQHFPYCQNGLL